MFVKQFKIYANVNTRSLLVGQEDSSIHQSKLMLQSEILSSSSSGRRTIPCLNQLSINHVRVLQEALNLVSWPTQITLLFLRHKWPCKLPRISHSVSTMPSFNIMDANIPTGFYCRQATHCGKGMVFSINPSSEKTHVQFKEKAVAQNGNGALPPIVGGQPPAASSVPGAAPSNVAAPPPSQAQPGNGMATGIGQVNNGQCTCSCLCGVASFPNPALQGRGAFGGMSGAMPMAALEK